MCSQGNEIDGPAGHSRVSKSKAEGLGAAGSGHPLDLPRAAQTSEKAAAAHPSHRCPRRKPSVSGQRLQGPSCTRRQVSREPCPHGWNSLLFAKAVIRSLGLPLGPFGREDGAAQQAGEHGHPGAGRRACKEIRQDLPLQLLRSPGSGHRRGHLTREEEERVLAAPGAGPSGHRADRPRVSSPSAAMQGQPSSARSFIHSFLQYRPVPGAGDTAEVLDTAVVPACVGLPACGRERS